ncbi:hypothetical protein ONS96_013442 [Cadophora gregata f. sp. sojae]|nr:hypothetical protein ONS96_013442 [Cadophora gregata f. sp. sojae]
MPLLSSSVNQVHSQQSNITQTAQHGTAQRSSGKQGKEGKGKGRREGKGKKRREREEEKGKGRREGKGKNGDDDKTAYFHLFRYPIVTRMMTAGMGNGPGELRPGKPLCGSRSEPGAGLDINPMELFDLAKRRGRVLYCAAPMVRYSKLAFRQTVAQYGVDLTWTPMILAKEFNRSVLARDSDFTTCPNPPPTIVQLGVNSPLEIVRTTTLLAPHVNGIDINCGCPQSWACAETLGAALMHHPTLVASMVSSAKSTLHELGYEGKKTISVKIRIHKDLRQTLDFVRQVEDAGVDFITVHGRMRSTRSSEPVNLDAIRVVKEHAKVPVVANGDVFSLADVERIVRETGVDGVMSARGLLECPGLFASPSSSPLSESIFSFSVSKNGY